MTFPLNEMYGYSRLCDRLRSSAIIWKQVSLRSSAIRDRLRSFAIIWKPALKEKPGSLGNARDKRDTRLFLSSVSQGRQFFFCLEFVFIIGIFHVWWVMST